MSKQDTQWEPTKTPGLYVRRPGRGYYARVTLNGKRTFRSLKTEKLREAQKKLREIQEGHARPPSTKADDKLHKAMAKVIDFRSVRRGIDKPLKQSTKNYHAEILRIAQAAFPDRALAEFDETGLLNTIAEMRQGRSRKKAVFDLLKGTFAKAAESGAIKTNPLAGHRVSQVPKKERKLPTREQLDQIIEIVPKLFPRYGHRAALSIRLLAFSGMRLGEARALEWSDIADDKITIRGEDGLKWREEGETRELHINPPLQAVLDDIAGIYGKVGKVMKGKNMRPQLKAACDELGLQVLTNHDLKSWFITWNLQSGIDVSTISDWTGTSPSVILDRYASMQDEVKKQSAAKLS